mmetsp:Transcript_16943/g.47243  ORF Transcript_16943/g.47243 Transcript_16943/m.47243 type:complete len:221 (-) Transcript_16943:591-1253(-)
MWGFGNVGSARPSGSWMGPVESALNGLFLGYYQWLFLLMCAAPAGWLDVAHQFLGLTFPLSALFYIVSTLIFNRDWICGREVCVVVMVGLAGAARAGHARLHPEAQMLWPYSFTAYNGFWFGEAVVLVSIAWFTHFQHIQFVRFSKRSRGTRFCPSYGASTRGPTSEKLAETEAPALTTARGESMGAFCKPPPFRPPTRAGMQRMRLKHTQVKARKKSMV